ncbi:MAG: dTDP-glucose 4,6-dehydratase [Ruminococcus sp.]|nr:dTDP-glucose 4,6-dehydratase [Ruminococcus sp.]
MNIVVTGGAGFIGSNFVFYMLGEHPDDRIICLDKLTYAGNLSTLSSVMDNPNFRFVKLDICDREGVYRLFEEEHPDIVVNFAAESHVDRSIENPEIFLQTNILGTQVLMDACRKYGIQRYHQVSTDEVYGDLPLDRPDLFFTEETPIHTSSPYSSSKAGADLLVLAYHRTYGLPVTISRCSNNYGPYHFPEKLIPLMIANALADKPLPVYGKGENVRDWLYVEDHCKAIDLIIRKGRVGEVYNVGGHNEMANIDIVKLICRELGKPESLITYVTDRKGHDLRYAIDPTKIHNELGWLPETKFEDGIKKTIRWYLDNKEWWQEIINGEYRNYYEKMYGNMGTDKMKVFVTGVGGQLGYDVMHELSRRGLECVGSDIMEKSRDDYVRLDITDKAAVDRALSEIKPDAVIHCAAWTAVDAAEDEENREKVFAVNAGGTRNIAEACRKLDCKMLYISTDYVFDGQGEEPWQADCREFAPLNAYGQSKLDGELAVAQTLEKFFIVRIAWVFGLNGNNFIKTMINVGKKYDTVRVVNDQIGTPTYTPDLSRLLVDMIETDKYGYYHATNEGGFISWYDFCREFYRQYGLGTRVVPVTTAEYGLSKAARPFNSRLDKSKLAEMGFEPLPPWQDAVKRYLEEARL